MDVILLNSSPTVDSSGKSDGTLYRTIGPYKIAHALRNANYSVQVIDHILFFSEDELYSMMKNYAGPETSVIGISTTFLMGKGTRAKFPIHIANAINRITDEYPKIKVIFGGYYVSALSYPKNSIKKAWGVVSKFGEDIAVDVINWINERGPNPGYELGNPPTIKLFNKPLVEQYDIEKDAFRFHDSDMVIPGETLPIEISRGCIFKCKFCNHLMLGRGKLDYLRDFELVKEEMLSNYSKWGTTKYYIICDTFNDTEFKMKAWYNMVETLPFKIQYTSYLRADLLDRMPTVPYMLQESGLVSGFHGIESFGVEASQAIGKGWSGKSAREYIPKLYHDIWGKKVHQTLSFIVGLPGDTRESILETAQWFNDSDLFHVTFTGLSIMKNVGRNSSEFDRETEKYGYKFTHDTRWKSANWTSNDVEIYKEDMQNYVRPYNSRFGSWQIASLIQFGIPLDAFKGKQYADVAKIYNPEEKRNAMLEEYKQLLLA